MKYAFIAQHKNTWPIDLMCRVLGVKRNGYYGYWRRVKDAPVYRLHEEMIEAVKEIAKDSQYSYGIRRIKYAMHARGFPISLSKVRKLMKEADVQVRHRKKFKVTTDSNHHQPVFDNVLDRQFNVSEPDRVYVSDITYIWTQQGWLYLAVMIDLFSRRVVGWSMSSRMNAGLVCDAPYPGYRSPSQFEWEMVELRKVA